MVGDAGFGGRRVVSFESRRAAEMASLVERQGGVAVSAPSMREVRLPDDGRARSFAADLSAGVFDVVLLLTGVGTRALVDAVQPDIPREAFAAALAKTRVVVRGPKPAAALRELGVSSFVTVPEPNTWREVLVVLATSGPLSGSQIAVQEYGVPNDDLYAALRDAGATVTPIPIYRWALPEDTGPLRDALRSIATGGIPIALFTSRAQVEHVFLVAAEEGLTEEVRRHLADGMVASIGPICSEALRLEGLTPDLEPGHAKMGHLVKEAAASAAEVLRSKEASAPSRQNHS